MICQRLKLPSFTSLMLLFPSADFTVGSEVFKKSVCYTGKQGGDPSHTCLQNLKFLFFGFCFL